MILLLKRSRNSFLKWTGTMRRGNVFVWKSRGSMRSDWGGRRVRQERKSWQSRWRCCVSYRRPKTIFWAKFYAVCQHQHPHPIMCPLAMPVFMNKAHQTTQKTACLPRCRHPHFYSLSSVIFCYQLIVINSNNWRMCSTTYYIKTYILNVQLRKMARHCLHFINYNLSDWTLGTVFNLVFIVKFVYLLWCNKYFLPVGQHNFGAFLNYVHVPTSTHLFLNFLHCSCLILCICTQLLQQFTKSTRDVIIFHK